MYVQIQTVDGQFFGSDPVLFEDSGLNIQEWEQQVEAVRDLLKSWRDMDYLCLQIGGREKSFNPANIVWAELVE